MSQTVGIDIKVNSQGAEKEINGINQALLSIGKAGAALVTLDKIKDIGIYAAKTADQFTALEGRLADVMEGFGSLDHAMDSIKRISSETGAGIQTVGVMFEKVSDSAKNAGRSAADAEKLVETLSRLKAAYNIEDTGFSSAMMQFNQALSTGILRGEEFNGVFEGASPIIRAMAQSLGVNVGHMRQIAEAGALTTEKIFMLTSQLPAMIEKMDKAPKTISTEWGKLISEIDQSFVSLNNVLGVTEKIARVMGILANGIRKTREGTPQVIKIPRTKEQIGADIEKSGGVNRRSKLTKDQMIENIYNREQDEFEKQKSAGAAEFSLASAQKEQENAAAAQAKIDQAKKAAGENANFERLKAEAKAAAGTGKTKSGEQLAAAEQQKNNELNALAEQGEQAKRDQLAQRRAEELQKLQEHKEAQLEIESRYGALMREGEEIKNDSINGMDEQTKKKHMSRLKNYGLQTLNEAGNYSKKMFEISKAANLADAIIFGYTSVQRALRDFPVPYNFAVAGLVAAQTAVQVRGIRAQKYGGGGSFTPATGGGGASAQGFGAISEKFSDKSDSKPQKQVNITIADGDIFSAKSVRELIKKIGEEVGNNLVLTTG